jgi:nitrous oxidase accessory protein NosD
MNLQEQINLANPGDTISIPDGERCIGNFIINKPLTIMGGAGSTIIAPPGHAGTDWKYLP